MAQECATDKDDGPKNPLSELMDLSETSVQVDGLLLHLTLLAIISCITTGVSKSATHGFYVIQHPWGALMQQLNTCVAQFKLKN